MTKQKLVEFESEGEKVLVPNEEYNSFYDCYRKLSQFVNLQKSNVITYAQEEDRKFYERLKSRRKKRKCLSCDQEFVSFHRGNRICPDCKELRRVDRPNKITLHSTWGDIKYE